MRRPLCTFLASFVLLTNLLDAQESKSQPGVVSAAGANTTIMSLLQQSHDVGQQLPLPVRLNLLSRQAEMALHLDADVGREWANELFTFSSQAKGGQPQYAAIGMLIELEPGRALELLHSLNIEEPVPKWATTPPEMQLVHEIFQVLVKRDGASALPLLEQESDRLGHQGHYPYAALGDAAMQATSKDWGADNQRAIRLLQSVFEPAFARYSQSTHSYYDDFEFGRMLQAFAGDLPFDSVQPALRLLVRNLLATDTRNHQFELEAYTTDGKTVKVHNTIDATLLFFGMLINRDPELVQQLESTRPELQPTLEYAKGGRLSMHFHAPRSSSRLGQETSMDAVHLSLVNPEAAIAKAEQLPDDQRPNTMLDVARNIAGNYPERAAELIAEIQRGNKPADDEMYVNLISAQAFVAAAQNKKDELRGLLQRGFDSANRAILEQQRTGGTHFFNGLGSLAQIGIENAPDLTITFIEGLSPSYLKAELLLGAATDLSTGMRVPIRFQAQQTVQKARQ